MIIAESLKKYDKDEVMLDIIKLLELTTKQNTFLHELQEYIAEEAARVFDNKVFNFHLISYYMHLARTDALKSKNN